jgi:hypothetical protein
MVLILNQIDMTQEDKYIIENLYIMDVKTLDMSKVKVDEVDACEFALFVFNERKHWFNLRGANIQTLENSGGHSARYIVSKDLGSLYWIKESFQWLIGNIGFTLRDAWDKIYNEQFDDYKHIK